MILGYSISANDNGNYFIKDWRSLPEEYLYKNSYHFDYDVMLPGLKMIKRKFDIGYTYDGYCIVSENFKQLCEQNAFSGLEFLQLPGDKNFYVFRTHNDVEIDTVAANVYYYKFSMKYNNFWGIYRSTPVTLKNKQPLPEGTIYRSDIFYGDGVTKHPTLMVGIKTKELIYSWNLKGIYWQQVLDEYPKINKPTGKKNNNGKIFSFTRRFVKRVKRLFGKKRF